VRTISRGLGSKTSKPASRTAAERVFSCAASIARTPATCLEAWPGDHRQTPGGLKQNTESKAFRRKLINRLLALRGQGKYVQAHELGGIAQRYPDCPEGTFPWNCGSY